MKKFISVGSCFVIGLILVLAGAGLITLTQTLLLYGGMVMLALAVFFFLRG